MLMFCHRIYHITSRSVLILLHLNNTKNIYCMRYNYISSYMIYQILNIQPTKTNSDISTTEDGQQIQGTSSWRHETTLTNLWKLHEISTREIGNNPMVSGCCVFSILKAMYWCCFHCCASCWFPIPRSFQVISVPQHSWKKKVVDNSNSPGCHSP